MHKHVCVMSPPFMNSVLERPELGEDKNAVGVSEISIENESEEVKCKVNRDEVGKVNNPRSSLVSAGFQTANGKKIFISKKSQISVQNILREFQDNLQETNYETEVKDIKARMSIKSIEFKFGKNTNSSAQIANKTGFQATFKIHQDNVDKINEKYLFINMNLKDIENCMCTYLHQIENIQIKEIINI
ncbi:hypothetical protein GQX74_010748 [Glossina fuscipes]|nr:hypothetical protein GQX74_010748 [Glossina fuscipes]